MNSEDESDTVALLACYILRDALAVEIKTRKARIAYDRAAAMTRFNAYEKNDFRRRSFC
jgi:hypothetical protein